MSFFLAAVTILSRPGVAICELVLDQQYEVNPVSSAGSVHEFISRAQTFTVGVSGLLARVELQVARTTSPTAPLVIEFRRTLPNGGPNLSTDAVLATLVAPTSQFPAFSFPTTAFVAFELGQQSFSVTTGDLLAINLRSSTGGFDTSTTYLWASRDSSDAQYTRGQAFVNTGSLLAQTTRDNGFRTYVQAIPEPSSIALLSLFGIATYIAARPRHNADAARSKAL